LAIRLTIPRRKTAGSSGGCFVRSSPLPAQTATPTPTAIAPAATPSAQRCFDGEAVVLSYSRASISNYGAVNRLLAGGALAIFIAAMAAIALSSVGSDGSGSTPATTTATPTRVVTRPRPAPRPKPVRIKLVALGPYDPPPGDGRENDAEVANAVDGDPTTFWSTEHYTHGFFKPGVGIVLDAGRRRRIGRVLVSTDDVGSRAEIQLADAPTGPYRAVSADKALAGRTAFPLKAGTRGRYILVWVTAVPTATGEAHITEVQARSG